MITNDRGIVFYEGSDSPSPLHTLLNAGQTSVSDALDDLEDRISEGATLLDQITLPTNSRTGVLTVPVELRNTFRRFRVEVDASATTTQSNIPVRPTSIRINGDGGPNYRSNASIFRGNSIDGGQQQDDTGFPRMMYLGSQRGAAYVDFFFRDASPRSYGTWTGQGWFNSGSSANENNGTFLSGGRWNVSETQTISTFVIYTNASGAFYGNQSTATLWGYR